MKIVDHFKTDWFRYGFETIAVVVGILVAFTLENWRDTQKVKDEEHEILVNLLNDLHNAEQQSFSFLNNENASRKYLILALNQNSRNDSLPQAFYSDSIFNDIIWNLEMDVPIIHSYSDIMNTGKSGLITNEKIRQRFTNLELSINNLRNQIDDRLRVQQLRIDEIVVHDLNYVRMISLRFPEISTDDEKENDYQSILTIQRIRNILALKLNLTQEVIIYRMALDEEMKSLISLLEEELSLHHIEIS